MSLSLWVSSWNKCEIECVYWCANCNLTTDLESPEGIAIDHLGRTMFWTDSVEDHIEVASLDGSQRRVIIDSDLVNPRAIITDPPNGCVMSLQVIKVFVASCWTGHCTDSKPVLITVICIGLTGTARPPRLRPLTWMDPTDGCWLKMTSACQTVWLTTFRAPCFAG